MTDALRASRMEHQVDQVRTIMTAGDRLDDITRARMWSAIEDQVSAPAAAARPARLMRTTAIALGALAVAAAAILVVRARGTDNADELTVAADATLTHRLGPHARAALVGPARLELLGPPGPATSVRLHAGTLLADFDGGPGRSLRIEAGDLVAEVVGTLFAIEVTDHRACVAVAHGTVRVTSRGSIQLVTDQQQLCSGDSAPHPIPATAAEQLARHERALAIAMGSAPAPSMSPPSAVTPPIDVPPVAPVTSTPPAPSPVTVAATTPRSSATPIPPSRAPKVVASSAPATPRPSVTATTPRTAIAPPRGPETATGASSPATPRPSVTATTAPSTTPTRESDPASSSTTPRPSVASAPPSPHDPITEPPPAAPVPPAPPPPSAEELYRAAEVALAAGDRAAAVRALTRILTLPGAALADQALYELARIEYQRRAWTAARKHLAALAVIAGTPLAEPGRYLDCRIAVEAKARDAERCFAGYRSAYPRSPHDLDVLAVLVQLAHARAGCDGARTLRDELISRYPRTDHAAAWRSRCTEAP